MAILIINKFIKISDGKESGRRKRQRWKKKSQRLGKGEEEGRKSVGWCRGVKGVAKNRFGTIQPAGPRKVSLPPGWKFKSLTNYIQIN